MAQRRRPRSVPDIPGPTPTPVRPPKPPVGPKPPVTPPWRDDYDRSGPMTGEGGIFNRTTTRWDQNSGAGGTYGRPAFKTTTTQSVTRATGKPAGKPTTSVTRYGYNAGKGRAPYSKGTPVKRNTTKTAVRGVSNRGTRKTAI
jgi:hypothetical protein